MNAPLSARFQCCTMHATEATLPHPPASNAWGVFRQQRPEGQYQLDEHGQKSKLFAQRWSQLQQAVQATPFRSCGWVDEWEVRAGWCRMPCRCVKRAHDIAKRHRNARQRDTGFRRKRPYQAPTLQLHHFLESDVTAALLHTPIWPAAREAHVCSYGELRFARRLWPSIGLSCAPAEALSFGTLAIAKVGLIMKPK
jgi:hypothetical protein